MNKTIHLPDELVREIEKKARKNGATFSGVVRISLEKYIKNGNDKDTDDSC